MPAEGICHRCGKPVGVNNQVIVYGKLYGTICAKDVKSLIELRDIHPELLHLCSGSFCTDCKKTFNCPLKSSLENNLYQLDMF